VDGAVVDGVPVALGLGVAADAPINACAGECGADDAAGQHRTGDRGAGDCDSNLAHVLQLLRNCFHRPASVNRAETKW